MALDPKLEAYLSALDRALSAIPVSDRAEIVTEIKSHILEALTRDSTATLESTLASMGEAETVANRYLLERGLKPAKPPKHPIIKWLVIGFLGTITAFLLFIVVMVWKFSPLITIDEKSERVTLLGGMIDINGKEGKVKVGSSFVHSESRTFEGHKDIDPKKIRQAEILFANGGVELTTAPTNRLTWKCKLDSGAEPDGSFVSEKDATLSLRLDQALRARCEVAVPSGIDVRIQGLNGRIVIERVQSNVDANIKNGQIRIAPDTARAYRYETHLVNGKMDPFTSSTDPKALLIRADVGNGRIQQVQSGQEDEE